LHNFTAGVGFRADIPSPARARFVLAMARRRFAAEPIARELRPMNVAGVSLLSSYSQSAQNGSIQNPRAAWQSLASALNAGDLAGAQSAFALLQNSLLGGQPVSANGTTTGTVSTPVSASVNPPATAAGTDFNSLAQALQSGDLKSAQGAFARIVQDARGASIRRSPSSPPTRCGREPVDRADCGDQCGGCGQRRRRQQRLRTGGWNQPARLRRTGVRPAAIRVRF